MNELLGLVGFAFVSSVTPGPNNVLLWASGAAFGFRRTLPHVLGTALGLAAMALASASGLAALIAAAPPLAVVMRLAGSGYLLWLAWRIAGSGALRAGSSARPMTLPGAAAFQLANPKAWIFALGAVTAFRPADLPPGPGTVAITLVMAAVIVPSAAMWAGFGDGLGRLMERERTRRLVNGLLALLVVGAIALVWV